MRQAARAIPVVFAGSCTCVCASYVAVVSRPRTNVPWPSSVCAYVPMICKHRAFARARVCGCASPVSAVARGSAAASAGHSGVRRRTCRLRQGGSHLACCSASPCDRMVGMNICVQAAAAAASAGLQSTAQQRMRQAHVRAGECACSRCLLRLHACMRPPARPRALLAPRTPMCSSRPPGESASWRIMSPSSMVSFSSFTLRLGTGKAARRRAA